MSNVYRHQTNWISTHLFDRTFDDLKIVSLWSPSVAYEMRALVYLRLLNSWLLKYFRWVASEDNGVKLGHIEIKASLIVSKSYYQDI